MSINQPISPILPHSIAYPRRETERPTSQNREVQVHARRTGERPTLPARPGETGSTHLPPRRILERVQETVSGYLGAQTLWYGASAGAADQTVVRLLLDAHQQVIVVGYDAYDISDRIRMLLETYQAPFVDPIQEKLSGIPNALSIRDILFCTKADLVILLWDGLSEGTRHLLEWLRQQRKDHLVAYIEFAVRHWGSQEIARGSAHSSSIASPKLKKR